MEHFVSASLEENDAIFKLGEGKKRLGIIAYQIIGH